MGSGKRAPALLEEMFVPTICNKPPKEAHMAAGYVDGFVLPVPKKNVKAYRRMAAEGARIWKKHGALEYRECEGDDLKVKMGLPFPRGLKVKKGETVFFSWIVYKSKAHRDQVNARVMKEMEKKYEGAASKSMPFDDKRMLYGGFKISVEA
jgi:uncharacterized protein YbaA (DUF1428 family)